MKSVPILEVAPLAADRVKAFDGSRPYLATGGVGDEAELTPTGVTYSDRPTRADLCVQPGDVSFARMQGTKKILEFDAEHADLILSTGFAVLRPRTNRLHPGYLRHWVSSDAFQFAKDRLCSGATQKAITNEKLELLTIALPARLDEQRRIAEILDKADALRAKRRAALAQLDTLNQSIFLDMFGDPATNLKGWPRASLRELGRVVTGGTPPSAKSGMFGGEIPFITPGDLESDEPVKRTLTEAGANESVTVGLGATLVCCIGATIGKIGKATVRSALNQQINAVEWGEAMDGDYGVAVMRLFKPTIVAWGTSTTLPILKKSLFERIEIPVPPLEAQRQFARHVSQVEKLRRAGASALVVTGELFDALQSQAFVGEL